MKYVVAEGEGGDASVGSRSKSQSVLQFPRTTNPSPRQ
jgi:hypothetical protein